MFNRKFAIGFTVLIIVDEYLNFLKAQYTLWPDASLG